MQLIDFVFIDEIPLIPISKIDYREFEKRNRRNVSKMDIEALKTAGEQLLPIAQDTIPSIVTALMTTLFLRQNTQAKEIVKLKQQKLYEMAEDMLDKGQITYYEFYKCKNFLKIAKLADKIKKQSTYESKTNSEFDFDWFVRFFEACSNISNEQMQELWAQVLAGEVNNPGSFSLRTVETLNRITHNEAISFLEISNLAMCTADGMWFVLAEGPSSFNLDEVNDLIIPNNKIRLLQECGLLNPIKDDMMVWYSTKKLNSPVNLDDNFIIRNDTSVLVFHATDVLKSPQKRIKKEQSVYFPYYPLTEAGRQLLPIVKVDSEYNYMLELGNAINDHSKNLIRAVTAHEIARIEDKMLYFKQDNILQKS